MKVKRSAYSLVLGLVAAGLLACAHQPHSHDDHHHGHDDHHHHEDLGRLVIHEAGGSVRVLDAADGDVLASFKAALPPGAARIAVNHSGEYAFVSHLASGRTLIIDSGYHLEDHGGHDDLELHEPGLLGSLEAGAGSLATSRGQSAIYNPASGRLNLIQDKQLRSNPVMSGWAIEGTEPFFILSSDSLLLANQGGSRVEVRNLDGRLLQSLDTGSQLAGQARFGRFFIFGSREGISLVSWEGPDYEASLVPYPPEIGANRVDRLRQAVLPFVVGATTPDPWLLRFSPVSGDFRSLRLPGSFEHFGFDKSSAYLLVLETSGTLHSIDPQTFAIRKSLKLASPAGGQTPLLAIGDAHAWVYDPSSRRIRLVELKSMTVEAEWTMPAPIDGLAVMKTAGVIH